MPEEKLSIEKEIEGFAKLAFSQEEVATIIGIPVNVLLKNECYINAYNRGKLLGRAELIKSVAEACKNGSSVAQAQMSKLFDKQNIADADF